MLLYIYIEMLLYRSTYKENILNNKYKLWLMKSSASIYYKRLLDYITNTNLNKGNAEELSGARQLVVMNKKQA